MKEVGQTLYSAKHDLFTALRHSTEELHLDEGKRAKRQKPFEIVYILFLRFSVLCNGRPADQDGIAYHLRCGESEDQRIDPHLIPSPDEEVSWFRGMLRKFSATPAVLPVWRQLTRCCAASSRSATPSSSAAPRATDSSGLGPRRFYERVTVERTPSAEKGNGNINRGFLVHLDGKPALTSARHPLQAQSRTLAIAIAGEWDAQQDRLRPSSMPLTRLLAASLDVVKDDKQRFQDNILRFVHTDSFALRADYPRELVNRQNELFEPVEDHLKQLGIHYRIVRGGLEATQEQKTVDAIRDIVNQLDNLQLAAMDSAASCGKSAAVAVAMWHGLDAGQATNAARSEEVWQAEVWGSVEGGHDLDHADVCVRMNAAELVFRCASHQGESELT